jgi:hypothetical protein
LLATLNVDSKTNGFVTMDLQKRAQEAALSELGCTSASVLLIPPISFQKSATAKQPALPFLISGLGYLASKLRKNNGQHCGEYRVIYHKNNGNRFFLSFEAKYPNPEIKKGKAGCFAVG